MSELSVSNTGDTIELHQAGTETLVIGPSVTPTLLITQDNGAQITLSQSVQNLILSTSASETLVIQEADSQTLIISGMDTDGGAGVVSSPYGRPYTSAEDGAYYYYAWQHTDGTQWKAQRFEMATLELLTITGANPQPETLPEFQNMSF